MSRDDERMTLREITDVAIRVGFPVVLGISGWTFANLWDHEGRIKTLEVTIEQREIEIDRRLDKLDRSLERLVEAVQRIDRKLGGPEHD